MGRDKRERKAFFSDMWEKETGSKGVRGETGFPQSECLRKVVAKVRTEGSTRGTTGPAEGRAVGALVVLITDGGTHTF